MSEINKIEPYDPNGNEPLHDYRGRVLSAVRAQIDVVERIGEEIAEFDKSHSEVPSLEVWAERLREILQKAELRVQQKKSARGLERQQLADKLIALNGWLLQRFDLYAQKAQSTDIHKVKTQIRRTLINEYDDYGDSPAPGGSYFYRYGVTVSRRKGLEIYYTAEAYTPRGYEPYEPLEGFDRNNRKTAKDKALIVDWFGRKLLSYAIKNTVSMEELYGMLMNERENYND